MNACWKKANDHTVLMNGFDVLTLKIFYTVVDSNDWIDKMAEKILENLFLAI